MAVTRRMSPYVLLTLSPLFWAGNSIIGRGVHADIPPWLTSRYGSRRPDVDEAAAVGTD